ncbi:MAG: ATP-binding protein, partial [Hydrogenophaga sp.]|nr:ATP-binding protein [Hydrogenophaga sp.]
MNDLSSRLLNVEPLLREMTREASRATSLFLEERNQQIQQQGKAVTTLTVLQLLLLLCSVVLLVRHINRQQSQYLSLKLLSGQLESARSEAERANQAKSVYLANMSHEIRTPFQGLMGMLNLLKSTELNNAQRDYVETALDSAQHLLGVLNDILDMSTIDSGSFKLLISTVNLEELTGNTQELMSQVAADKGIDLQFEFDNTLPRWVRGDAMRIRQILFNLIGNAIKFTQQGEVRIIVTAKDGNEEIVSIVVQDTGAGMDDETLERLFTRFYQADNSFLRKMGGTGLGLEISRSLARMMGGDITVTSKLGQGSRFELTLKLPEATAPLQSQEDPQVQPAAYQSLRLLVAEDHPINLKYMNLL